MNTKWLPHSHPLLSAARSHRYLAFQFKVPKFSPNTITVLLYFVCSVLKTVASQWSVIYSNHFVRRTRGTAWGSSEQSIFLFSCYKLRVSHYNTNSLSFLVLSQWRTDWVYSLFSQKAWGKDLSVYGKITFNWMLKTKAEECGLKTLTLGWGQMAGCWTI